jgi:PAS domain S-box-containing protein
MKKTPKNPEPVPPGAPDLRRQAEAIELRRRMEAGIARLQKPSAALSPEETQRLLHELQVHQIELELQNEQLRRTQVALEESGERYFDLYDLAPVGYVTVSEEGMLLEANLAVATLMGMPRGALVRQMFSAFILKEDQDIYYHHRRQLFETGVPQAVDLRMQKPDGAIFWAHLDAAAVKDAEGGPACRIVLGDITARKQAELTLSERESHYRVLFESSSDALLLLAADTGRVLEANAMALALYGYGHDELLAMKNTDLSAEPDETFRYSREAQSSPGQVFNIPLRLHRRKDGTVFPVEITARSFVRNGQPVLLVACRDITARKQSEAYRELVRKILQILNEPAGFQDSIAQVLAALKTWIGVNAVGIRLRGFNAVGIRLQDGEDFPYFAQQGFSKDFLMTENTLVERGKDGGVCRDKDGKVSLECTCGLVLAGKTDPSNPLFTRGGSFWTNDSFPLLDLPPDQDPRLHPRNQCIHQGYASVALVPIRTKGGIMGMIQINDRRKGCFTLEIIEILEVIAAYVGMALMRRQAEEEQTRSHELLVNLARLVPGVIYQYRLYPDGRSAFPYSSPGLNDMYEVTPEEVREDATPAFGRLHPEDAARVRAAIHESARTLATFYCEFRVILPRQGLRWRWGQAQPERMEDGGTLWHGIISDITDRKQAEDALRAGEEKYRILVETTNTGFLILDHEGKVIDANAEYVRLTGRGKLGDILGRPVLEWTAGHDQERNAAAVAQCIRDGFVRNFLIDYVDGNGRITPVEVNAAIVGEGAAMRIVSLCRDITDRKQADDALRESVQNYRTLMDSGQALIWVAGPDKLCTYFNRVWLDFTGRTLGQEMGNGWTEGVHPEDFQHCLDVYVSAFDRREKFAMKYRLRRSDGEYRWLSDDGAPRYDSGGAFIGYIGHCFDITARMQAEADHARLEAQLQQARKMESVGLLAGGVAHDFNNMLGVILGRAELALMRLAPDQPLHADLMEIRKAAERSAALTRQLLAFARKELIMPRVLDLNETVGDMLKMLRRLIGEDISLVWQPGSHLWSVNVDPSQIDQIMANLCINARDAIAGAGRVFIETGNSSFDADFCASHPDFTPGDYVHIYVSDSGCGMDANTLAHLFEPFFTTKEVGKGTGLGLASAYGAVTQNKGFINVYSELGKGTTFKIFLPRHADETAPKPREAPAPPAARGAETILLVEDERSILTLVTVMLKKHGYTVLAANTPEKAVRLARDYVGPVHMLMTDVVMPGMDGQALAKELQALYPHIRCLFMSGYTADIIAHHGVLDEGTHFIQKPFDIKALAAKVRAALDEK